MAIQVAKALGASVTGICSAKNMHFVSGACGADAVVIYDGEVSVEEALKRQAALHGPFDLVLDCVSSHDPRDLVHGYEETIRGAVFYPAVVPGGCLSSAEAPAPQKVLQGKYVCLGGVFASWVAAGLKGALGLDIFSAGRELFWIRLPRSSGLLTELELMAAEGRLRHRIGRILPFTDEGVQEAFRLLNERRVVGKVVVSVSEGGGCPDRL